MGQELQRSKLNRPEASLFKFRCLWREIEFRPNCCLLSCIMGNVSTIFLVVLDKEESLLLLNCPVIML